MEKKLPDLIQSGSSDPFLSGSSNWHIRAGYSKINHFKNLPEEKPITVQDWEIKEPHLKEPHLIEAESLKSHESRRDSRHAIHTESKTNPNPVQVKKEEYPAFPVGLINLSIARDNLNKETIEQLKKEIFDVWVQSANLPFASLDNMEASRFIRYHKNITTNPEMMKMMKDPSRLEDPILKSKMEKELAKGQKKKDKHL